ncbi:MAG TPA: hypothetical protein VN665_01375 [Candidatus Paceibacterota bacterium]|nr:hypothetical protein [Candidatus Paceibacterota bacterium]
MDKKLAVASLIIFIVAIFSFAGTMAWFIIFKERVCALNLNSPACTEGYLTFLHIESNRI